MQLDKTVVFRVGDYEIHAQEEGDNKKPLALLIHGWSSSRFALSPIVPFLEKRYHCIAVDLPGYGDSPRLPKRTTIPDYAKAMAELIKAISPDKPVTLIGHSMGGMISLTLTLQHPELVERLVLICPTISGKLSLFINLFASPITTIERFAIFNRIVSLLEPYFFWITDRIMRPASFAEDSGLSEDIYKRLRADARRSGQGKVRAECYHAMRKNDLRGKLGGLTIPTLAIWGMEDNTVPLRDASALARELPAADLRIIPNAGHWPQFETPKTTERYIRAFLNTPLKLLKFNQSFEVDTLFAEEA